ncbi:hypothetical protein HK100_003129, partial [Physocladia obscura]
MSSGESTIVAATVDSNSSSFKTPPSPLASSLFPDPILKQEQFDPLSTSPSNHSPSDNNVLSSSLPSASASSSIPPQLSSKINHAVHLIARISGAIDKNSIWQNHAALRRLAARSNSIAVLLRRVVSFSDSGVTTDGVADLLVEFLEALDAFVEKQKDSKFMNNLVNKDGISARIAQFNQDLTSIATDLSLAVEIDMKLWAEEDREDRRLDLEELDQTLQHLVDNDYKILNALELKQIEYFEAIEALQKNLANHIDRSLEKSLERVFMERALVCLRRASEAQGGAQINKPNSTPAPWVLTSWEIEIGDLVSRGGFGEVLKATWLGHTIVAVKRLHMRLETSKLRDDFLREVKTWFPLRHPNIVPLLGACATADRPFMVSPFMSRGHALQYMDSLPRTARAALEPGCKLLFEVSLGMQYLHARGVIHGDLKAVNVLVDLYGTAYVADFGFATLKQFTSTRHTGGAGANAPSFGGTLRWMSPERLQGAKLAPPVDVYAFAMTCFEVVSEGEVPYTDTPDALLYQHVVHAHLRPTRPQCMEESEEGGENGGVGRVFANAAGEHLWKVMSECWAPDPLARPSFGTLSVSMKSILKEAATIVVNTNTSAIANSNSNAAKNNSSDLAVATSCSKSFSSKSLESSGDDVSSETPSTIGSNENIFKIQQLAPSPLQIQISPQGIPVSLPFPTANFGTPMSPFPSPLRNFQHHQQQQHQRQHLLLQQQQQQHQYQQQEKLLHQQLQQEQIHHMRQLQELNQEKEAKSLEHKQLELEQKQKQLEIDRMELNLQREQMELDRQRHSMIADRSASFGAGGFENDGSLSKGRDERERPTTYPSRRGRRGSNHARREWRPEHEKNEQEDQHWQRGGGRTKKVQLVEISKSVSKKSFHEEISSEVESSETSQKSERDESFSDASDVEIDPSSSSNDKKTRDSNGAITADGSKKSNKTAPDLEFES